MMKKRFVSDPLSAAHALAVNVLKKADHAFYRQRRTMEDIRRIISFLVKFIF